MSKVTRLVNKEREKRRKMTEKTGKNLNGVFVGHREMKKYTLDQGMNTYWFIHKDGLLIAGFLEKELAEEVLKLLIDELE